MKDILIRYGAAACVPGTPEGGFVASRSQNQIIEKGPADIRKVVIGIAVGFAFIGPSYDAIEDSDEELITRIKHRCCNGSCSYETFRFPRCVQSDDAGQPDASGLCIEFTKTGFRPYDIAVTAALLIAKRALKNQFVVHTDGTDCQWSDAKRICQSVLGYGDWFGIVEEQVEEELPGSSDRRVALIRTLVEIHPPALN